MNRNDDELYYEIIAQLKEVSVTSVPSNRLAPLQEILQDEIFELGQILSVELITGTNGRTQKSSCLCIAYRDHYERQIILVSHNQRLLQAFDRETA